MPPVGRPAVGLAACLAVVSGGPVQSLVVPADGLVPGYECGRCGTLSLDADETARFLVRVPTMAFALMLGLVALGAVCL
jgi:hypothetical protein